MQVMTLPLPVSERLPCPTVLLLHDLPDGSSHVDWMLARDRAGRLPLLSFRLERRLDELASSQSASAMHIGDHRPTYLAYEGPVSGGRGAVTRVRTGEVIAVSSDHFSPDTWLISIKWFCTGDKELRQSLQLTSGEGQQWSIQCVEFVQRAAAHTHRDQVPALREEQT